MASRFCPSTTLNEAAGIQSSYLYYIFAHFCREQKLTQTTPTKIIRIPYPHVLNIIPRKQGNHYLTTKKNNKLSTFETSQLNLTQKKSHLLCNLVSVGSCSHPLTVYNYNEKGAVHKNEQKLCCWHVGGQFACFN